MRWAAALVLLAGCDKVFLKDAPAAPADADERPAACPSEFLGARYVAFTQKLEWPEAEAACASLVGVRMYSHLAVIGDAAEAKVVVDMIRPNEAWVGLTDRKDHMLFRWITEEPVMGEIPWLPGQPNLPPRPPVGRCGRILDDSGDMGLADGPCDESKLVFCECDEFPIDPERFSQAAR